MTSPLTHGLQVSDADLWQHLVDLGMHEDDATKSVLLHRDRRAHLPARFQSQTDAQGLPAEEGAAGPWTSAAGDLLHEASMGVGEPISGAVSALEGKGFQKGAADYHNAVDDIEAANPYHAALGGIVGAVAMPGAGGGRSAARGIEAGVAMGGKKLAGRVIRGAATGALTGAIGGAATGGESLDERIRAAKAQGGVGALMGGTIGMFAIPRVRGAVEREADVADRGVQREGNRVRLENAKKRGTMLDRQLAPEPSQADVIRQKLTAMGVPPEKIEEAVRNAAPNTAPAVENITSEPQAPTRPRFNLFRNPDEAGAELSKQPFFEQPDPMDIPTYLRRQPPAGPGRTVGGNVTMKQMPPDTEVLSKYLARSKVEAAPELTKIGQDAIPGKPELGKFTAPGKYQKAGPAVRVQSAPMPPQNIPHALSQIAKNPNDTRAVAFFVKAARDYGNSEEEIVKQLHAAGVDGGALREAMGSPAEAAVND